MKIVFVVLPYVIDPLGIAYLSAIAKRAGHSVDLEHVGSVDEIDFNRYDVVAFSLTTGEHGMYGEISKKLKAKYPHLVIIWGGPHPTYFTEADPCVDYIVRGEADLSWPQLLNDIAAGVKRDRIVQPTPLVQDLDSLPIPDRGLIYKFSKNLENPIKNILTSRGCPFSCPYCYNSSYKALYPNQKIVRVHGIDRVIAECEELKNKWKTKFIFFDDDEFSINDARLSAFADRYTKEVALPYHAQLRIDLLTDKKAKLLRDSGCVSVSFAIESGSERYRKEMLKRNMTDEQIVSGSKLLHKYGIGFRLYNMLGLPHESFDEAMDTLRLSIKCKPEATRAIFYQPYPGTPLGDLCIREGLFNGSVDDIGLIPFEDSVLPLPNRKKFVNLQRLFGIVAGLPFLRLLLPILLVVPNNRFYDWVYRTWKSRQYDKALYVYDKKTPS